MKLVSILFILLSLTTFDPNLKQEADKAYTAQEWSKAIKSYKKYLKTNETDSSAWYRLGISHYQSGNQKEAIICLDKALATQFYPGYALYAKSRCLASLGNEMSLELLADAADNGYADFNSLDEDKEWFEYEDNDQFKTIYQRIKSNAYPCLNNESARHFDFWIGEWDVYANGRKVGENSITMAEGGCAIHENYTTPRTYSGQSINYYDRKDKKWHQTWVDSNGGVLDYIEINRAAGMLQFQCDYLNRQGQQLKSRLTFTLNEDGSVRQLFEDSEDGENWTNSFDGLYKRKE